MKALTNILNYILLLLMILIASCTKDAAEVDDLVRGEEYVTVRMHIPGMKAVATRAAETDNITSIVALVFRNDQLQSVTEYSTTNSALHPISPISGTITIEKPANGDVIHFLANLPANYSDGVTYVNYLKGFINQNKTQEDVLRNLSSRDYSKLSYWGMATRNDNNAVMDVMLYRNKAMIEIKPGENCTFRQDELFIAGLDNPNNVGLLVPYNGGFNFDLDNNDYLTLPADPDPLDKTDELTNYGAGYDNAYYVFEHENPDDANGLYVICKIGDDYYKVALHDEKGQPYLIIRNHKYTILVNDLDAGCETYSEALSAKPIKPTVIETKDVTLTLSPQISTLNYSSAQASVEAITVKVGGLQGVVEKLTFNAPGFIISSDYAESEGNGVYRIINSSLQDIDFTFTLDNPSAENAGSISVTGEGGNVNTINTASTTVTLTESSVPEGQTIIWQGAVVMNVSDDGAKNAAKITIPYSFFFDGSGNLQIPVGSKVVVESTGNGWMQAFRIKGEWVNIWDINSGTSELTLTQDVLNTIKEYHETAWGVDAAFVLQGDNGRVLNKVMLIPAKERITAEADKSQLYYDSDDTQVVTVDVTVPNGVSAITIGGAENFTIAKTAGNGTLNGTGTTYTMGSERTATFTFTLNAQNVTAQQTITFSDPSETVNSASVDISMAQTPTVTFGYQDKQTINLTGGYLDVQMNGNNVPNDKTVTLTITAPDFTVTAQNGTALTQNGNEWTYQGTLTTLRFTPTSEGDNKSISISGGGVDVNVKSETISVNVKEAVSEISATSGTIDMGSGQTSTTITLTKPSSVNGVNVNITDANGTSANTKFSITMYNYTLNCNNGQFGTINHGDENIPLEFAVIDENISAGVYTVTFRDAYNNQTTPGSTTITVVNTPKVTFTNTSDKTLYWNNGSPTSFQVQMTGVPDGKNVTLSIANALAFTITDANSNELQLDGDNYTYTGGNTTFTIKPKDANSVRVDAYTIGFSGTCDGVNVVPAEVSVKVMNEKPAQTETILWTGSWGDWNNNNRNLTEKVSGISTYYKRNNKIVVYFTTTQKNALFSFRTGSYNVIDKQYSYSDIVETSCTLELTDTVMAKINGEGNLVQIVASYINVTKISVIETSGTD